jgi:hypothetical protein
MSDLREATARAIFGHWRNSPRLPEDQLAKAWTELPDAFKAAWLTCADFAMAAYKKVEEQQMAQRFGPCWGTKLAWAIKQMEMMP